MIIGTVGICFALAVTPPGTGVENIKCYADSTAKYETQKECHAGSRLYLDHVGKHMVVQYSARYAKDKPWEGKRRLMFKFTYSCKEAI